ncbi:hypothetical protein IFT59_21000 [Rhizobium sp. CFBP 8752]|uniref:hypothetical protein n=1 Tax=Rhizobium sp. CFBP 8752 TaxID=2775301 RepID=UPI0017826763|nr:hypothetical protein [Rhizobium sp. CFBP 8752]MBD8665727.1 hypothetical protein [Rhizobium sp. CFBP 8752]
MRAARHEEFENVIENYFHNASVNSKDDQDRLIVLFKRTKKLVDLAVRQWARTQPELADRLIVSFTAGLALSPEATGQPPEYYRIVVPLAVVHRMSDTAIYCSNALREKPYSASDPDVSVLIAVLLAFGHEFYHIVSGHIALKLPDGSEAPNDFQEASADFMGAACLARWLIVDEIKSLLGTGSYNTRAIGFQVMFSLTLLSLIFADEPGPGYPRPNERLRSYLDGFAFGCEGRWWEVHPLIVLTQREPVPALYEAFRAADLEENAGQLWLNLPEVYDPSSRYYSAADQATRRTWYNNAPLLRPIAGDLLRVVPRLPQ